MPFITRSVSPTDTYLFVPHHFWQHPPNRLPQLSKLPLTIDHRSSTIIEPIYPSLGTLKSGNLRKIISSALDTTPSIPDPLSLAVRQKNNLIDLDTAIRIIHAPPSRPGLEGLEAAIRRLAFDELYTLQLESLQNSELHKVCGQSLHYDSQRLNDFLTSLPFTPTNAQTRVIGEILADLAKPIAMHRLLSGEVGSGKTLVAATAALATHLSTHQTLVMAPTQILAQQLFSALTQLLPYPITHSLITASQKGDSHADVVVGTQALLSQKHNFGKVGLVVIDEQHKFGVKQREYLSSLNPTPHVLMMTATPIPRTLAMTIFSSMDISHLDELPNNRLPIKTYLVGEDKRDRAYSWIKNEVLTGHNRVFIVVPIIEEVEDERKSLKSLETDLKKRFPSLVVDIINGKMKETENSASPSIP